MSSLNHQDTETPRNFAPISDDMDKIGKAIVDCAFQVHSTLGPGLLENIYEEAFICELDERSLAYKAQDTIHIPYKNKVLKNTYRLDLIVEDQIIIELKATENLQPVHKAQILTYLKLTNLRLGYLINFNVPLIKNGINRIAL